MTTPQIAHKRTLSAIRRQQKFKPIVAPEKIARLKSNLPTLAGSVDPMLELMQRVRSPSPTEVEEAKARAEAEALLTPLPQVVRAVSPTDGLSLKQRVRR